MWWVSKKNKTRRYVGLSERGATTVFVAVSLIGLLAMTAFSFDFGRVYVERRELQVGAEAAALAIARDCAKGLCLAAYDVLVEAEYYVDANARDGAAWIQDVDLDMAAQQVHVISGNEDPDGNRNFDMVFGRVVGVNDYTVGAEATAVWGPPGRLRALPLVFSECEWYEYGGGGGFVGEPDDADDSDDYLHRATVVEAGLLPPALGYPFADRHTTIYFHGANGTCHHSPSGQDLPGGFGWLDSDDECGVDVEAETEEEVDPGASPSNGCGVPDLGAMIGTVQLLPYFDEYDGTGTNAEYHISGFGAFYITGYNFGGQFKERSLIDNQYPCSGNDRCIEGYMIGDWVASGGSDIGGGGDFGVNVIGLSG